MQGTANTLTFSINEPGINLEDVAELDQAFEEDLDILFDSALLAKGLESATAFSVGDDYIKFESDGDFNYVRIIAALTNAD